MSERKLLPCAHCGKHPGIPESCYDLSYTEDADGAALQCQNCKATGPWMDVTEEDGKDGLFDMTDEEFARLLDKLAERWNTRYKCPFCLRPTTHSPKECPANQPIPDTQTQEAWNRRAPQSKGSRKLEEALKVACVTLAVTHKDDFVKAFGMDGLRKLLKDTEHLRPEVTGKDFKVEEFLREALRNERGKESER